MDEDYSMVYGIDKLAELLIERGIEFYDAGWRGRTRTASTH